MPKEQTTPTDRQLKNLEKAEAFAAEVAGGDPAKRLKIRDLAYLLAEDPDSVSLAPPSEVMGGRGRARMAGTMRRMMGSIYDDPVFVRNSEILQRESPQGLRILGGIATAATEFPDCVAVGDDTDWCCTGTLVAPNVVVTAGHCAESCTARVYAGLNTNMPDSAKIFDVAHVIRHQGFDDSGSVIRNDLTVLIPNRDVPGVTPRKIAASAAIDGAAWLRVVGFGTTDTMGRIGYGRQRRVDVAIASPSCGDSSTASRYGCVSDLEIVAGSPNRDSCRGDSGGPAYVRSDGQWYLVGATSRATRGSRTPCGGGGIYVRVDKYRDFIRTVALADGGHWTD